MHAWLKGKQTSFCQVSRHTGLLNTMACLGCAAAIEKDILFLELTYRIQTLSVMPPEMCTAMVIPLGCDEYLIPHLAKSLEPGLLIALSALGVMCTIQSLVFSKKSRQ